VTPKEILEKAKDPKSPLHKYFEWDNSKAGEQYRIYQARHLARHPEIGEKDGD
jgi:hypothetical protein